MDTFEAQDQTSHVEHLTHNLKMTVSRFQEDPTPENFAHIITSLRAFGVSGKELWDQALSYTRQYPMRVALFAGILFYALKGISEPSTAKDDFQKVAEDLH